MHNVSRVDPMQWPTLGILILNHNGRRWLAPLYRSIQANEYPDVRVYLVDNASADDSIKMTLRDHPEVTVRMPQNFGYCMAYNLAIPYAVADGCEWLIWANNDVLLEAGVPEESGPCLPGAQGHWCGRSRFSSLGS